MGQVQIMADRTMACDVGVSLMVASDVVYEPGQIARLVKSAHALLAADAHCIVSLSSHFLSLVTPLCVAGEVAGFRSSTLTHATGQFVVLTRGAPPALPRLPLRAAALEVVGLDRAELLFA